MSTWRSARNTDERLFEPRRHPVFPRSTFFACRCELGCSILDVNMLSITMHACVCYHQDTSPRQTLWLLRGGVDHESWESSSQKACTLSCAAHPKGLCRTKCLRLLVRRLQVQKNSPHLAQYPPTTFSPAQSRSEGEKLEVYVFLLSESTG